ncbi:hypothetical protein LTR95_015824 [Oleoguttula sp. CCFEE 5521]
MGLLDLPTELLVLILEEVGGSALRRGAGIGVHRLTLSRKWYEAAHPVYLSGLNVTDIRVTGSTCGTLESKWGHEDHRRLMHKNTRALHVRLCGHWWESKTISNDSDFPMVVEANRFYYEIGGPPLAFDPSNPDDEGSQGIKQWQDATLQDGALKPFFKDLQNFSELDSVYFEVFRAEAEELGPQWNYLHAETCRLLLTNLPLCSDLTSLTLDTSGSALINSPGHFHICTTLATVIPQISKVRLRMVSLCPEIFNLASSTTSNPKLRLTSLVIKLSQPSFPGTTHYMTTECFHTSHYPRTLRLHDKVISAAATFASNLKQLGHDLNTLRISMYYYQEDNFCYEDDGSPCWVEDDDDVMREGEVYVLGRHV